MLNNQTIGTLTDLGLKGMADAFREQLESVQYLELSFEERFAMLVDREAMDREARRLATRLRAAKLRHSGGAQSGELPLGRTQRSCADRLYGPLGRRNAGR